MLNENKFKIILGGVYLSIVIAFLLIFFSHFSIEDFSSYELIKNNRNKLNDIKNSNLFFTSLLFVIFVIFWVLLLGFGSPILLIGGFIFGKWVGTILVVLGLSIGATFLYVLVNYFFKNLIEKKLSNKFSNLTERLKKNEFIFISIYRFIGGIPFAIANVLPTLFNIKVKNYFFGTLIGMAPQIFVGVSLGSGLNEIIETNSEIPSIFEVILSPEIYLPILGILSILILAFFLRKKFFK